MGALVDEDLDTQSYEGALVDEHLDTQSYGPRTSLGTERYRPPRVIDGSRCELPGDCSFDVYFFREAMGRRGVNTKRKPEKNRQRAEGVGVGGMTTVVLTTCWYLFGTFRVDCSTK